MYSLKENRKNPIHKGFCESSTKKVRFSVYLPENFLDYLEELKEKEELNSRNKAVVEVIESHMEEENDA